MAQLVGGQYSWKFFITDQIPPFPDNYGAYRSYNEFIAQAERLKIKVVTATDLPMWRKVLKSELFHPTYPLI